MCRMNVTDTKLCLPEKSLNVVPDTDSIFKTGKEQRSQYKPYGYFKLF